MTQDPFVHLPDLRARLIPAGESTMRFTPDVLAQRDARVREMGYSNQWRQSDEHISKAWTSFMAGRPTQRDLWVFGYGSLMWDPGFEFVEVRRATVNGYQRRFAMKIEVVTGSPEHPALALSLERQLGRCTGLAFRIPSHLVERETEILWRREFILFNYRAEIVTAWTPQGNVDAAVFASDVTDPRYVAGLSMTATAELIARARGVKGDNKSYVERLAENLANLGLADDYILDLQRALARYKDKPF